jgi:putative Ca2+/H+ antiporter (TMEM165/GDT1 family)
LLLDLHTVGGWIAIVVNGLAGLFALVAWRAQALRGRPVWVAVGVAQAVMMVQVLLGVLLVTAEDFEPPRFHMFYGFVAFITVGLLYSYKYVWKARGWMELAYGLGGLFIMGLGIRAVLQVTT